jgi:hypothetical protein
MLTGTKLADVMGSNLDQVMLICELIAEEGTEQVKEMKATVEMKHGTEEEAPAVAFFENKTGKKVERIGLAKSDEFEYLLCSPDGFIADKNGKYTEAIEVKCPNASTAVFYKLEALVDEKEFALTPAKKPFLNVHAQYKWQIVNYFLVNTDLQKLYFVTYDNRFITDDTKMFIVEVTRDNELLQEALNEAKSKLVLFRARWLKYKGLFLPDNF